MKKKLFVVLMSLVLFSPVFAEKGHFLLQADVNTWCFDVSYWKNPPYYNDLQIGTEWTFVPLPYICASYEFPSDSAFESSLGIKVFSILVENQLELVYQCSYTFNKPETWNKYHLELAGKIGAGADLSYFKFFHAAPIAEITLELSLAPDEKGFFVGLGPACFLRCDISSLDSFNFDTTYGFELSTGWKF